MPRLVFHPASSVGGPVEQDLNRDAYEPLLLGSLQGLSCRLPIRLHVGAANGIAICRYVSGVRSQCNRDHADERLPVHLRLQTV
jgi:hypothetical protein